MSSDSQATLPLPGASRGDMDVVDSPELSDSPELTGSQPDGRCAHCEDSEALLAFGVEVMGRTTDEKVCASCAARIFCGLNYGCLLAGERARRLPAPVAPAGPEPEEEPRPLKRLRGSSQLDHLCEACSEFQCHARLHLQSRSRSLCQFCTAICLLQIHTKQEAFPADCSQPVVFL